MNDDKGEWLEALDGPMDARLLNAASTPNDLTDEHIAHCHAFAARHPQVGLIGLTRFVDYIVKDWHRESKLDFVNDVVVQGKCRPARWRFFECDLECPAVDDDAWAQVSVAHYLGCFNGLGGERWFTRIPVPPTLHSTCYQPGIVFRNLRYYEVPKIPGFGGRNTTAAMLTRLTDDELPVAIRRLLAKRLGWAAHTLLLEPGAAITVDALMHAANIDSATMSADAEQALNAIVVEMDGVGGDRAKADRCVGEGPEALYR